MDIANRDDGNDQHISILVGADHYQDIVLGKVIKGSAGPVAFSSKIGWLLSGPVISQNNISTCSNVTSNLVLEVLASKMKYLMNTKRLLHQYNYFIGRQICDGYARSNRTYNKEITTKDITNPRSFFHLIQHKTMHKIYERGSITTFF